MGYYTDYDIECSYPSKLVEIIEVIDEVSGHILPDNCKWYEHEIDMQIVSARFPDVLITVTGKGEDPEDLWRMYCLNGQTEKVHATITYPEPSLIKRNV